jgi:hypothetical protein
MLRIRVEREDVADCLVQVISLIEEGLAMECRDILVEVHSEEIEVPDPGIDRDPIVSELTVKIIGGFGCNWADLLIAPGVARYKENRYPM